MHGKIKYRMSNQCFDYFLGIFKGMLPKDNCLPKDHRHTQKVLNCLGLGCEKNSRLQKQLYFILQRE